MAKKKHLKVWDIPVVDQEVINRTGVLDNAYARTEQELIDAINYLERTHRAYYSEVKSELKISVRDRNRQTRMLNLVEA